MLRIKLENQTFLFFFVFEPLHLDSDWLKRPNVSSVNVACQTNHSDIRTTNTLAEFWRMRHVLVLVLVFYALIYDGLWTKHALRSADIKRHLFCLLLSLCFCCKIVFFLLTDYTITVASSWCGAVDWTLSIYRAGRKCQTVTQRLKK